LIEKKKKKKETRKKKKIDMFLFSTDLRSEVKRPVCFQSFRARVQNNFQKTKPKTAKKKKKWR